MLLRRRILGPGDELGFQYFPFPQLIVGTQAWMGEHVAQAFQPCGAGMHRQLEEEVGGALTGLCVQLAAMPLYVGHQPVVRGKPFSTQKQQMFEKVRQARPGPWGIVATGGDPQDCRAAFQAGGMTK
ncbi:hypothetical protein D3C84_496050 [compost metagenome]